MSHDICPDTGEPCTCDGSEPCTCGCGGCGHTEEEEAAAAAYREAHREDPSGDALDHERKIIVSFDSTFDVMECEQLCLDAGVPGRIMPLPGSITAGCGLCWAMPFSGDALAAFRAATEGRITPRRLPSTRPLTTNITTKVPVPNVVVRNMWTKQLRNTRFVRQVPKNASTCIVIKTKHLLVGLCETLL